MKRKAVAALLAAGLSVGLGSAANAATYFEGEAFTGAALNNSMATAQSIGALGEHGLNTVFGSRQDFAPGGSSADFYKLRLTTESLLGLTVIGSSDMSGQSNPILGLFNSSGKLIATDDDSGAGFGSFLSGTQAAGIYYIAVSGSPDAQFHGGGSSNWVYSLSAKTGESACYPVPEPDLASLALLSLGAVGFVKRRRKTA